jgi:uncharacterized integral membrane protein
MSAPPGQLPQQEHGERHAERRSPREMARTGVFLVLALAAILFIAKNGKEVRVDWIVGSGRAPLIIVIVISLLAGIVLTRLADRLGRRRRR